MEARDFISFLNTIEKLKCNTRHSWTSSGRHESVAEHCWRTAVMALMCRDEFPRIDIAKVAEMCLIHDFGEAILGDIPAFYKTEQNEFDEFGAVMSLLETLPHELCSRWSELFLEMNALETDEAKLFKSLDNMEAVISHNEAPLPTWIPLEYTENLTYGRENAEWSRWTAELRETLRRDSVSKLEKGE